MMFSLNDSKIILSKRQRVIQGLESLPELVMDSPDPVCYPFHRWTLSKSPSIPLSEDLHLK